MLVLVHQIHVVLVTKDISRIEFRFGGGVGGDGCGRHQVEIFGEELIHDGVMGKVEVFVERAVAIDEGFGIKVEFRENVEKDGDIQG